MFVNRDELCDGKPLRSEQRAKPFLGKVQELPILLF